MLAPLIFIINFSISFRLRFYLISGAVILGPRIDRFRDTNSKYIAGHSIPLISLGGFILIFGFMAFNAGSQVYLQNVLVTFRHLISHMN